MKYLCLLYFDETQWPKIPKPEQEKSLSEVFAYNESIKQSGHYLASNALQPTQSATTVRVRNGKLVITDGPFAETKEQLGGYYLIEARDLNEAIQISARNPGSHYGSIEVRPIWEIPQLRANERHGVARDSDGNFNLRVPPQNV